MTPSTQPTKSLSKAKLKVGLSGLLMLSLAAASTQAQPTLSIDSQGPTAWGGVMNSGGIYLAAPAPGPLPIPGLVGGPGVIGIVPGPLGRTELDALSWGEDTQLQTNATGTAWRTGYRMAFSTDEYAVGIPALGAPPDLFSEGVVGNAEASADVQVMSIFPSLPTAPVGPGPLFGHSSWLDGNGLAPFGGFGIGLVDPNFPNVNVVPDPGDNLDAIDFRGVGSRLYFSLDARWQDPFEGPISNTGTAAANGVRPGDVLVSSGAGVFAVYAAAAQLGLGPRDDLDALILAESGDGIFTPSEKPFDWVGSDIDMLLFSVRRGSPVIGTVDSLLGIPIEEGDILTTPYPGGPSTGPAIFIAAEVIGLTTVRSGTNLFLSGDDLNALTVR